MTKSSPKENDNSVEFSVTPAVPDGGWGWFVVLGSFIINFLTMGIMKSFGILVVAFMEVYPTASTASLMWINAFAFAIVFLLAPITTGVGKVYGFRREVFIGGVLSGIGYILSAFVPSVLGLYFTMGLVSGLGFSLTWIPALVIVGVYFDKKRSIAMGFTLAGSGMGAFLCPVLLQVLLDYYGYRGTLMIFGGILLNACVAASLYRPMHMCMPKKKLMIKIPQLPIEEGDTVELSPVRDNHGGGDFDVNMSPLLVDETPQGTEKAVVWQANDEISKNVEDDCHLKKDDYDKRCDHHEHHHHHHLHHPLKSTLCKSVEYLQDDALFEYAAPEFRVVEDDNRQFEKAEELKSQSTLAYCRRRLLGLCSRKSKEPLLNFSLLKNYKLRANLLSIVLLQYSYITYYNLLPMKCREAGISSDDTALLVAVPSIVEMVGRVTMGFVWDMPCVVRNMRRHNSYALGLFVGSIGILLTSAYKNYYWIVATSVVTGWGCSMFIVITPSLIVDLYGVENLVAASGFLFWIQAIPILTGGPLLGFMRDMTGNTDIPFYFMGSVMMLSCLVMFFLMPIAERFEERRTRKYAPATSN